MAKDDSDTKLVGTHILVIVLGVFVVVALVVARYLIVNRWYREPTGPGEFGDMFGGVNALFSGLAFVGVIYAILLQRIELQMQRMEMKRSIEAQEASQLALEQRLDLEESLARKRTSIDLYDEWHSSQMHESRIVVDRFLEKRRNRSEAVPTLTDFESSINLPSKDVLA